VSGATLIRDRYEPLDVLGRGAQGEVWKALDRQHGRVVALKIRSAPDEQRRDELLAEARLLLMLRPHPNLPLVREDFFWTDRYVLVMDWVDGSDLGTVLLDTGDPGLPVSSVLGWLREAARAIDHLHAQGVVHGDVKPANLVLTHDGNVVLVDFGISKQPPTGVVRAVGSPDYEAPEVAREGLRPAADVYGLAATAVALLTGAPPGGRPSDWEGVPNATAIDRAVRRGLDTDPARRPRTASELVERLQAHLTLDLPTGVVTFLLTDIAGSTVRWETEPDVMSDLIARHDNVMADTVEASGGRLLKTRGEGDSTFSVFTRASNAVHAALAAQRSLRQSTDLSVRMAIHTGEAETRDGDYFGRTVNRAARLRGIADGGQVLLSSAAADLVVDALPDSASLIDIGFRELRDLARGEQVFALAHRDLELPSEAMQREGAATVETAPLPEPLADPLDETRDEATFRAAFPIALQAARSVRVSDEHAGTLEVLTRAFDRAVQGSGGLVLINGDAGGHGLSVAAEAAAEAYEEGATVLHGVCTQGSDLSFEPFAAALALLVADARGAGLLPALGPLAGELVRLAPDLAEIMTGNGAAPLRADSEIQRYRLFDAVASWLHALAAASPVVFVLEDLEWATRDTMQLLRHVLRSMEAARVSIVATCLVGSVTDLGDLPGIERVTLTATTS
jgi:class 3 adenylate cyclase/predicted Ser/Thr protein kinase